MGLPSQSIAGPHVGTDKPIYHGVEQDAKSPARESADTSAKEGMKVVTGDPWLAIYPDVKDFLNTFAPKVLQPAYTKIVKALEAKGLFNSSTNQWCHLPQRPQTEKSLYDPWIEIANVVSKAAPERKDGMVLKWERSADSPLDSCMKSLLRPDVTAVLVPRKRSEAGEDFPQWRHWHRLIVPGEFKKANDQTHSAIYQVFNYSRQMFKEQPDRRFLFAFSFSSRFLRVWYVDRSCALGSEEIDVHKDHEAFIRFIVMMSTLPGDKLGFDPTMLAWSVKGKHEPSYKTSEPPVDLLTMKWVITMPWNGPGARKGVDTDSVDLVLFKTLSQNRAEVLRGRAVRIWLAWRLDEMSMEESQRRVYTIKDSWHQDDRVTEGELYADLGHCPNLAIMYGHQVVTIDGREDTTVTNQQGLNFEGLQSIPLHKYQQPAMQSSNVDLSERDTAFSPTIAIGTPHDHWLDIVADQKPIVVFQRKHTRICLSTGVPIFYFLDHLELCRAFSGVVTGHHSLVEQDVIHRDMALGNLMIDLTDSPSRGMIIDLDHAKKRGTASVNSDGRTGTPAFMAAEQLDPKLAVGRLETYATDDETDDETNDETNAETDSDSDGEVEAYLQRSVRPRVPDAIAPIRHSVLHDMESILWVLCYICIFYTGPGDARDWTKESPMTRSLAWALFDGGSWKACASWKMIVLTFPGYFEVNVTGLFTPYFAPMAFLAQAWCAILYKAYRRGNEHGIHKKFRQKIDKMKKYFSKRLERRRDAYMLSEDRVKFLHDKRKVRAPEALLPAFEPLQVQIKRDLVETGRDLSAEVLSAAVNQSKKKGRSKSGEVHVLEDGMSRI